MSKKLPPMKRVAKRKVTLTGKTKTNKGASEVATKAKNKPSPAQVVDDAPLPQAVGKPHARTTKKSEADRIAKGKKLAASYLMQRDGMDADTAAMVVDNMDADTINELNSEAATAVLAKTAETATAAAPSTPAPSPADAGAAQAEEGAEGAAADPIDFLSVPALAEFATPENESFAEIAIRCRDAAATKNSSEKQYKADKKMMDAIMANAGVDKLQPLTVFDVKLVRYTGKSPRYLSDIKLLEAGVSPDIIAKCWVQGTYDDVRVTTIKAEG